MEGPDPFFHLPGGEDPACSRLQLTRWLAQVLWVVASLTIRASCGPSGLPAARRIAVVSVAAADAAPCFLHGGLGTSDP